MKTFRAGEVCRLNFQALLSRLAPLPARMPMIIKKGQPSKPLPLSHVPSLSQHALFSLIYGGLNGPLDYVKFSHNFLMETSDIEKF